MPVLPVNSSIVPIPINSLPAVGNVPHLQEGMGNLAAPERRGGGKYAGAVVLWRFRRSRSTFLSVRMFPFLNGHVRNLF